MPSPRTSLLLVYSPPSSQSTGSGAPSSQVRAPTVPFRELVFFGWWAIFGAIVTCIAFLMFRPGFQFHSTRFMVMCFHDLGIRSVRETNFSFCLLDRWVIYMWWVKKRFLIFFVDLWKPSFRAYHTLPHSIILRDVLNRVRVYIVSIGHRGCGIIPGSVCRRPFR